MTEAQKSIPKWILIVSVLFAVMEFGVSLSLWLSPESIADTVDINAKGVKYIIDIWAARQFALGFVFALAAIKRSVPMLTIAYVFLLVMFGGDFFIGISQKENSLIIGGLVMCIISSAMLFVLSKRK